MYSQAHHTIGLSMALGKSVLRSVPVSVSYLFIYLTLHRPLCDIPFGNTLILWLQVTATYNNIN